MRLWEARWRGNNLFEIACNDIPRPYDLARLSARYGVRITEPICEHPEEIPLPDWTNEEGLLEYAPY